MDTIIEIKNLSVTLTDKNILSDLDLDIQKGEVLAVVGGSGSGKTTLLRSILMLIPAQGSIKVLGKEILNSDARTQQWVRRYWGMMFQHGALFSSLTLLENVMFPMKNETTLSERDMEELALIKISMAGLKPEAAHRYPAELSGGMKKRAAIARALALDPKILFLDEPTAGLDPHGASELDELVLDLKQSLGLTIIMVTHDLDTLWRTTDHIAFLGEGKVLGCSHIKQMMQSNEPMIKEYFGDIRAKMAAEKYNRV
jgi:phospholipid/cholesterol/gamma-HCH transport system ATP-binding protein